MSYKICYSPENSKKYFQSRKNMRIWWGKMCMLALVLAGGVWLKINGVPDFMIPGDSDVTRQAVSSLLADMKDGEPIEEAVVAFCEEILDPQK